MNVPAPDMQSSARPHGLARIQLLASVAMRPETLTAEELRCIMREFESTKASLQ